MVALAYGALVMTHNVSALIFSPFVAIYALGCGLFYRGIGTRNDEYITSLTPHMHLGGKSMQIDVTFPDGRRQTLLSVPEYNFNWQITYRAAEPIFIPKGTRLKIVAHFDNSKNNPLNPDPSKIIRWGSASETEMMDGWIEYVDDPRLH